MVEQLVSSCAMSRQVEVAVIGEVERSLIAGHRQNLCDKLVVFGQLHLNLAEHISRISLIQVRINVSQSEGRSLDKSLPVELVEAHDSSVQMVLSIDVLRQIVRLPVEIESGSSNAICHASNNRPKVRILRVKVLLQLVESHDDVSDDGSMGVGDLDSANNGPVADDLRKIGKEFRGTF